MDIEKDEEIIINNYRELERYVMQYKIMAEDIKFYRLSEDEPIYNIVFRKTLQFLELIRMHGFKWGSALPTFNCDDE